MQNWEGTAKEQCEVQAPCSSEMTTAEDSESEWQLGGEGKQSWERGTGKAPGVGSSPFYPGDWHDSQRLKQKQEPKMGI